MPGNINTLDLIIVAVTLLLALRGGLRGVMPEISGLLAFIVAIFAAGNSYIHSEVAKILASSLAEPAWAHTIAYAGIFIATFILTAVLLKIVDKILTSHAPNIIDRLLGALAGAAKGIMLCTLLLVCLHYLAPEAQLRRGSVLAPYVNSIWQALDSATGGFQKFPELALPDFR